MQRSPEPFTWGRNGQKLALSGVERDRDLANAFLRKGADFSPVGHWTQGLARVANGLIGGLMRADANERQDAYFEAEQDAQAEKEARNRSLMEALLGVPAEMNSSVHNHNTPPSEFSLNAAREAIAGIESAGSGDYAAVGPEHPKLGRPLGKYQVMEANIAPWSQEVLGREVTSEEFLASPGIQDAVFDAKFGQYQQKYGLEGAAQAWFGGEGGVGKTERQDSLGTGLGDYGRQFVDAYNQGMSGQSTPQQQQGRVSPQLLAAAFSSGDPGLTSMAQALFAQQQPEKPKDLITVPAGNTVWNPNTGEAAFTAPSQPDKGTSDIQNYNYYAEQSQQLGIQPKTFDEWSLERRRAGAVTVNTGNNGIDYGDPPAGMAWVRDQSGNVMSDERGVPQALPIKGTKLYNEQEQSAAASKNRDQGQRETADIQMQEIARARELIEGVPTWTTGFIGSIAKNIAGTGAYNLRTLLDTIKANIGFDQLNQMRQQSPTGGALGQVTERELAYLQAVAGSLDMGMDDESLLFNLQRLERRYQEVISGTSPVSPGRDAATQGDDVSDLLEKY